MSEATIHRLHILKRIQGVPYILSTRHTTPSGKVYIGITKCTVEKRWESGSGYKSNRHFYSAIKKYGWDNIKHGIVVTDLNKHQACKVEQSLIKYFDSTNPNRGGTTTVSVVNAAAWVYIQVMRPAKNLAKRIKASAQAASALENR